MAICCPQGRDTQICRKWNRNCMEPHGSAWYCMVLHGIKWYCIVSMPKKAKSFKNAFQKSLFQVASAP